MSDSFGLILYPKNGDSVDLTNEIISYTIRKDVFQGCAEISVDINPHRVISVAEEDWGFQFKINETLFIDGRIDTVRRRYSKGQWTMTLTGRDAVQAWVDSSVLIYKTYKKPDGTSKMTFREIVKDVVDQSSSITDEKTGQKVTLLPGTVDWGITQEAEQSIDLSQIIHIATSPGDTIFDFVSGLANSLGLIIYGRTSGLILIDKLVRFDKTVYYTLQNKPGSTDSNVLEGELSENIGGYHSVRRIMGQANGQTYDAQNPWGIKSSSNKLLTQTIDRTFPGLRKAKVVELTDTDLSSWTAAKFADAPETTRMLQNLRIAENRELFKFVYKVPGHGQWYNGSTINYEVNRKIKVEDELLGVSGWFIIMGLTFNGNKNEQTTTLELGSVDSTKPYAEMYDMIKAGGYSQQQVITFEPVQVKS